MRVPFKSPRIWIVPFILACLSPHTRAEHQVPPRPVGPNQQGANICRNYEPLASGIRVDQLYGRFDGRAFVPGDSLNAIERAIRDGAQPRQFQVPIRRATDTLKRELIPALLSLLSSNETRLYFGGYTREGDRADSHDGLEGLRVILQRSINGKLVKAIFAVRYNRETQSMELITGPDSIRVQLSYYDEQRQLRQPSLSFGTQTNGRAGRDRRITALNNDYYDPAGRPRDGVPPQAQVFQCASCHGSGPIKNLVFGQAYYRTPEARAFFNSEATEPPQTWEQAFRAQVTSPNGSFQEFRSAVPALPNALATNVIDNPRGALIPAELLDVVRQSCQQLFAP